MLNKFPFKTFKFTVPVTLLLILTAALVPAETPPVWGDLTPGPHGIGFTTIEKYDSSRTYRVKSDYFGAMLEGERARPLQVCLWYPAVTGPDDYTMVYSEYAYPYPANDSFMPLLANIQNRELVILLQQFNRDQTVLQDLMSIKLAAVRDAPAAEGAFPLIIYHNGPSCVENAVLCEYLASWGFVVAATHPLGLNSINAEPDQAWLETLIRDREFVLSEARRQPYVDGNKLGLLGFSFGSLGAVLMAMRNSDVDAVACLQSEFLNPQYKPFLTENAFFDPSRFAVPLLQIYAENEQHSDLSALDSLKYATVYRVKLNSLRNFDFTHYGAMATITSPPEQPPVEVIKTGYKTACEYVRNFFEAELNKNQAGFKFLSDPPGQPGFDSSFVTVAYHKGGELPPTADQFLDIINEYGTAKGVEIFEKFRKLYPDLELLQEARFNVLGYQMLQANRPDDAVRIFRMNAETFPASANVWDSYADGCLAVGDIKTATTCYKKVLEILPSDTTLNDQMRNTIKTNAENFLGNAETQTENR
jgi:dienelactone hydrolase